MVKKIMRDIMDIDIEEDKIIIQDGETTLSIKGVISRKYAIILVGLIIGILGIKDFDIPI